MCNIMVGRDGIEPSASSLSEKRSTSELTAREQLILPEIEALKQLWFCGRIFAVNFVRLLSWLMSSSAFDNYSCDPALNKHRPA